MAAAFEMRMCSKRNAPTGMMPVSECRRRRKNELPFPARKGATPGLTTTGGAGLAVATMTAPYEFQIGDANLLLCWRGESEVKGRGALESIRKRLQQLNSVPERIVNVNPIEAFERLISFWLEPSRFEELFQSR